MMHRAVHGDAPGLKDLFQLRSNVTPRQLRGHQYTLYKPTSHITVVRSFFSIRVVDLWNKLPTSIVCIRDRSVFSKAVLTWLNTNECNLF